MAKYWLCVLLLVTGIGCGSGTANKAEQMTLDDVPEKLMKIAHEKLPGVKFDQVIKKSNGDLEIRGKDEKGKVRDIEFSPSGEVTEIE